MDRAVTGTVRIAETTRRRRRSAARRSAGAEVSAPTTPPRHAGGVAGGLDGGQEIAVGDVLGELDVGGLGGEVDRGAHAGDLVELLLHAVDAGGAGHALDDEVGLAERDERGGGVGRGGHEIFFPEGGRRRRDAAPEPGA
jgi:hypothetical protein